MNCIFQMSRRRTNALTIEQKNREMLAKPSDDDDDTESIDVFVVRSEPIYHTNEEDGNDEEICEQEVNDVSDLLELRSVKKK